MCVRCGTGKIAWCTDPNKHEVERSLLTGEPIIDWKKIAIEAVAAIGECCGCSITGWDAERHLKEHLTPEEHKALLETWAAAERR